MIGYLSGKVVFLDQKNLILNVNNIGYEITFTKLSELKIGQEIQLFITHKRSEYGETLFGFLTIDEKIIFENLENIKGIGSRVVFSIMSDLEIKKWSDLNNISLDNLVKIPGVGKNTAQKFLLGLSNVIKKEIDIEELKNERSFADYEKKYKNEIDLLVEWGIKKSQLLEFLKENKETLSSMNSEGIIKFVLANVNK